MSEGSERRTEQDGNENLLKCSNCERIPEDDLDPEVDNCPDCGLPHLRDMVRLDCRNCGNDEFHFIQQPPDGSIRGPEPALECTDCGATPRVDDDGAWW